MAITSDKTFFESGTFSGESRKLFTIGCHFPPKLTNFETLQWKTAAGQSSCNSVGCLAPV